MLVVTYKQQSSNGVPPAFLRIDEALLVTTAQELTARVYEMLKRHLSPFVTASHLELQLPSGEVLLHHLPLFLYFNYGQHFQHITCQAKQVESIRAYHQRNEELYLTLVLRISHRSQLGKQEEITFLSKGDRNGVVALNERILPTDNVYITGKRIMLTNEALKWSDLLLQKWETLQNVRDRCLYVCLDRIQ